jgi:hypothetical protein
MMIIPRALRFACLAFLALGLSGCVQSTATITSNKASDYHANIKRLLVITDLGKALQDNDEGIFESKMTDALGACGIVVTFHRNNPLALRNDSQDAIRATLPDTVMTLGWKSAQSMGQGPINAVYIGSMVDLATKRVVWKAEIDFKSALSGGETLAASLIDRLKADTIIGAACPTPVVPKRGI